MRKLIYGGLFLALVGIGVFGFVGCEKEIKIETNDSELELVKDDSNLRFTFSYDSIISQYQGNNFTEVIDWQYKTSSKIIRSNINLDFNNFNATVIEKTDNSITLRTSENNELKFELVSEIGKNKKFKIKGTNRLIYLDVFSLENEFLSTFQNLNRGDQLISNDRWGPVIWAAATLIVAGVDFYCDRKIANDVRNCTANAQCSVVNSCSATCVQCCGN